ncbi:MAG: AAA family ATPase [Candidatus Hydrogenedentes bacterium]|nr:AAA family ATPase [Candidatus Hydrogenedentota bacterium]
MYEAYYGLREKPFNLTPDPKYLYLSEKHKEAFAHLLFGIKNRSGFVMVTGEIGTGKTTICRTLLGQLDENTEVAFIFNPYLSPEELLRKINEDFGIATTASTTRGLIDELNEYLLERNARGKNCVLVIDEAQNLAPPVLEQIRLLSNLETETQKLLQIVLIGQPELMQVLGLHELRQLNQRITARYHLHPLSADETKQYIAYRMRVAGARRRIYFTASAIKRIFKISGGTPRVINALCDRSLLIGYTKEIRDIGPAIARQAWKEVRGEQPRRSIWPQVRAWLPNPAVITAGIAVLLLAVFLRDRSVFEPAPPPAAAVQPTAAAQTKNSNIAREVAFAAQVPVEKAVQAEPPPVPLPTDTTFAGLVDRQDPTASRTAAVQAILRAWNLALLTNLPANDSVDALTEFAGANRLTTEVMKLTLDQIEAINLPALIKLHGRSRSIWVAVIGAEGNDFKITTASNETTLAPRDLINDCYLNEAIILWRDPYPDTVILKNGMSGEDVRVLQVQLRTLGRLERAPTGTFDEATAEAIRSIQKDAGLRVDGAAGRHTRMVLSSWLPGFNTPGLRGMPSVLLQDAARDEAQAVARPEADTEQKPAKAESKKPAEKKPEAKVAKVPGTSGPLDAAPKPQESPAGPPDVKAEELPKPSEQSPPPPAEAPVAPPAPAQPTAEPAPAESAPANQPSAPPVSTPPTDGQPPANNAAPAWPGGLPLVPAEPDAASP